MRTQVSCRELITYAATVSRTIRYQRASPKVLMLFRDSVHSFPRAFRATHRCEQRVLPSTTVTYERAMWIPLFSELLPRGFFPSSGRVSFSLPGKRLRLLAACSRRHIRKCVRTTMLLRLFRRHRLSTELKSVALTRRIRHATLPPFNHRQRSFAKAGPALLGRALYSPFPSPGGHSRQCLRT